ncbi:HTTM domain-containing protein [Chitinophaga nivalis]|uniref:HTTM-like domain-containing protein n=1 Tax=Chitinophaga nivalis TaxID=2991709 RepID=A0ABT3ILZ5_9BACT|nr:HTTM domain-containing protein [Chitinophaga nivalis]MCW3465335.1 hypothetical protein [Chitinophaga nivalis]MCW3484973.1 hypothetical protein [Chitinophaga nivalis]
MATIYRFLFLRREEDDLFLPFYRIACSLFLLIHFWAIRADFPFIYGNNGMIPADLSDLFKKPTIPTISNITTLLQQLIPMSNDTALLTIRAYYTLLGICLLVGFLSRISAIQLLLLHAILVNGAHLYSYGADTFTSIALLYCCLFPVGQQLSLDRLLFPRTAWVNPSFYRKILQLHICIVYFFSGLEKLIGFNWWNGEAIWKAIHLPFLYPSFNPDYSFMATYPVIPVLIGWMTILTEILYPVFIWKQAYRKTWLGLVLTMHTGIMITLSLYFFSTLMILLNLAAFMHLRKPGTVYAT